jgi:hypothetical protein
MQARLVFESLDRVLFGSGPIMGRKLPSVVEAKRWAGPGPEAQGERALAGTILALLMGVLVLGTSGAAAGASNLPTDPQNACPLTATTFDGWFQSGSVTLNGAVNPANSLVNLTPNCGFYQWGQQMFLWLTSPAPAEYGGGGGRVFDSPVFYDVSPLNASGQRTLIPHQAGVFHLFPLRAAQVGVHGLPVILDTSGRLLEVKPIDPKLKPEVRDATGKVVTISHAKLVAGKPVLLDVKRAPIMAAHIKTAVPRAMLMRAEVNPLIVQEFNIDGINFFIDPTLAVIDTEQGQAGDGSVLEAQTAANGSLVYYSTMVNDVYAYFLTGAFHGAITTSPANQFPTSQTDLTNTMNYAAAHGKPASSFPDQDALAIEIKTAWVLAAGLPNLSSYITEEATVPVYTHVSGTSWKPSGAQQTVTLALVGVHVVGSTAGHPEMVWASFEHFANTPLATYQYTSSAAGNPTKTVTQPTTGPWVFSANGTGLTFNVAHMAVSSTPVANSIAANPGFTISPSNTSRVQPFGMAGNNTPSNTQILSANNNVLSQLASGDIRGNYFLVGATWTPFGSNPGPTNDGVGTNLLANSTMETYQQGSNCFDCHQNNLQPPSGPTNPTTQISHVFGVTQPLF